MLQIRLLGQFDVRADGKRVVVPSRAGQSLFAYLALSAGTPHRREKLAGILWPDITDENARKNLRQELWRIRKAISTQDLSTDSYLLADEYTITFNREADYWLDVAILERPENDLQALTSGLSLYRSELLPGFYEDWILLERERIQTIFETKMGLLVEKLVEAESWSAVQEQSERWLALGNTPEPAYRALMLSHNARGDMAKVSATYQRCVDDLRNQFGIEPSAETHALYNGLLKGARVPRRVAPPQPSGTVTLLFTDIEGSMRLVDKLGDQYATVLAEHHEILRTAIQKWQGSEVDIQGDSLFVSFPRALDALQCAIEVQRTFAHHEWPQNEPIYVRMGLHTGEPLLTSTGYVGLDVYRAARIGDAAYGGQVLLSQTTRELVMRDLPPGIQILDLGEHRLKDMRYPIPIYQLVIDGLPAEFPPLKSQFMADEAPTPGEPPFKGLHYFDEHDADWFFGRELLTARLVNRLIRLPSPLEGDKPAARFLSVVIGASGSGKSSLVRAGLIPALKKGESLWDGTQPPAGSVDWRIYVLTPTAHPLEALAKELTRDSESVTATATLTDDLSKEPRSLALFLARNQPPVHTLLVIDQFEELFTLCHDDFEREAFIDNLLSAIGSAVTIIITLRADFYAHLAQYPELRDAVAKQQEYIGPMSTEELRRAIEEPAKRGHWEFEPGLVDLILRDVGDEPGALPLLSHALLETWKRRAGHTLTLKGYADAGGVHGAIAHTAESVYQNLSPDEQAIARDIFLRLTELGEGTEDTRRRASFEELMSDTEHAQEIRIVLNILADARLLTLTQDSAEVAHEALIREWPTLREWLDADREGLRLHRHLTEAAHDWELLERDAGALYRGAHLAQAREWAALHPNALNSGENAFLRASIDQEQREEQDREEQRQRELAAAKELAEIQRHSASRLRIRNRVITTVGTVALILALLAGMFGVQSNRNAVQAETNFNRAEAQRLALEANRLLLSGGSSEQIALLSLRSMKTHYTPEGDAALAAAARLDYPVQLFTHPREIRAVAFSPDGKFVLTGSFDKTARLWDAQSGQEVRRFTASTPIWDVAFSRDGKYIFGIAEGSGILWNTATGEGLYQVTRDAASVTFSHDGKSIFTGSWYDNNVIRWDTELRKEVGVFIKTSDPVTRITISPDDKYMLTFSRTATLWDLNTGRKLREYLFDASTGGPTAFSPDGKFVLIGSTDKIAHLLDIKTGNEVSKFIGHTNTITDLTFSPDSKYALTTSADKTMRIWDINTGQELQRFTSSAVMDAVDVSPDGKWVLTGSGDGRARLWRLDAVPPLPIFNHGTIVSALAFSPDGKLILTGGGVADDGSAARLWNPVTGQELQNFKGHTDTINYGVAFSPDGKYIVTASWDGTMRLWDTQTGHEVQRFIGKGDFDSVEFSRDGVYILTSGQDAVRLWDAKTGQEIRQFGEIGVVYRAAFSPDGKTILTAAPGVNDGRVRLWDVATGQLLREYQSAVGGMSSVDFSPDGKYVIADGADNVLRLWDVQTEKELRQFIGHTDSIYTATFSPDGKTIATASQDRTARLWDAQTGQELRRLTGHTAGLENVAFSPDGQYILTGSDDGTAMLWDVDYHTTIDYLCSRLLRDFTDEERVQYGIPDNASDCP